MKQKALAYLFSILFAVYIAGPSILLVLENDVEITVIIDLNEEEESKVNEGLKDIEAKILSQILSHDFPKVTDLAALQNSYSIHYNSEFKELLSPPPEKNTI